jgi:hypothetical protein
VAVRPHPLRARIGGASSSNSRLPVLADRAPALRMDRAMILLGELSFVRHSLHEATMRRLSLVLLAVTLCATTTRAQTVDLPVQANVLSINPFGFLFEWYNIEYEHAFNSTTSWSVGVGRFDFGDEDDGDETSYTSAEIKLRYYPSAEAPTKFSAGIAFGYSRVSDEDPGAVGPDKFDALAVGIDLGYSWLLGRTRQFFIGTGIGAKRLFPIGEDDDDDDETFGYPTLRLSVGYAF